jgi:glycosyltransferase involved in cell wall biosynthesis
MAEQEIKIVISVIMPVYNCQAFIKDSLQSIFAQKLPSELKLELSIYEDGSTDDTLQVLEQFLCKNNNNSNNYTIIISKNTSPNPKGGK